MKCILFSFYFTLIHPSFLLFYISCILLFNLFIFLLTFSIHLKKTSIYSHCSVNGEIRGYPYQEYLQDRIGILIFMEGRKAENSEKNLGSTGENQLKALLTWHRSWWGLNPGCTGERPWGLSLLHHPCFHCTLAFDIFFIFP